MPASIIRVTLVTCGDPNAPVAFFVTDAVSIVCFDTTPGQETDAVSAQIFRLFDYAISTDYDPATGHGSFFTLDGNPDIASYKVQL